MRCDIKTMQSKIFWVVVVMLGVFVLMQKFQASEGISVQQAQTMNQQGALLLDVREPQEYAEIHAPNATLIPWVSWVLVSMKSLLTKISRSQWSVVPVGVRRKLCSC